MLLVAAIVFVVGLLGLSVAVCWLFLLRNWLQASSLLLLSFVVVDCWAVLCCLLLEALSSVFLVPCFVFVLHLCLLVARVVFLIGCWRRLFCRSAALSLLLGYVHFKVKIR